MKTSSRTTMPSRARARAMAAVALAIAGCSHGHRASRREWQNFPPLGANLRAAPRGTTIPAADLGVDLVSARWN